MSAEGLNPWGLVPYPVSGYVRPGMAGADLSWLLGTVLFDGPEDSGAFLVGRLVEVVERVSGDLLAWLVSVECESFQTPELGSSSTTGLVEAVYRMWDSFVEGLAGGSPVAVGTSACALLGRLRSVRSRGGLSSLPVESLEADLGADLEALDALLWFIVVPGVGRTDPAFLTSLLRGEADGLLDDAGRVRWPRSRKEGVSDGR